MNRYRVYGLTIASELELPALVAADGGDAVDVVVRATPVAVPAGIERARGVGPMVVHRDHVIFAADAGRCAVRGGRVIDVEPAPGVDTDELETWLLGRAFAALLHQRGVFVLHADTVDVDGGAVAFTGASGQGKSTTAAAFCRAGYPLVTEDVTAIDGDTVLAGYPSLKLHTGPGADKERVRFAAGFDQRPRPLRAVYVVTDGESVAIDPLPPADAVRALIANAFCVAVFGEQEAHGLLTAAAAIARRGVVRRIVRPRTVAALDEVRRAVSADG